MKAVLKTFCGCVGVKELPLPGESVTVSWFSAQRGAACHRHFRLVGHFKTAHDDGWNLVYEEAGEVRDGDD
jgi:hypothetical protein